MAEKIAAVGKEEIRELPIKMSQVGHTEGFTEAYHQFLGTLNPEERGNMTPDRFRALPECRTLILAHYAQYIRCAPGHQYYSARSLDKAIKRRFGNIET